MPPPDAPPPQAAPPRPRRRWLRWILLGLALLILLPLGAAAILLARFDPEAQKPRIEAAVEAATGRAFRFAGPVAVKPSLLPTVTARDISLANPPGGGFSRPAMLTVRRAEVQFAILPLLLSRRLELRRVELDGADLLLERDAEGRPNWAFAHPAPPAGEDQAAPTPAAPAAQDAPGGTAFGLSVHRVLLTDGTATLRDGRTVTLALKRLLAEAKGFGEGAAERPIRLDGALALQGVPLSLEGEIGPPAALLRPTADAAPWPIRLALEAEGGAARLVAQGELARPAERQGYRIALDARIAALDRFAAALPDLPMLPLHDLRAAALLSDAGGGPGLSELRLGIGESDLNALYPGLRLTRLDATLPQPGGAMTLEGEGRVGALPVALAGTLGDPAGLLPRAALAPAGARAAPYPVDLILRAGEAQATVKGGIAEPQRLAGVDLAVALHVPDAAALAPLAPGLPAPAGLRALEARARLAERGPGFTGGAFLRDLAITSAAGDLAGELTYVIGTRPGVAGQLAGHRLDLDALRPAPSAPPAPAAVPAPAAPAPAVPPSPPRDGRLIPDLPLPLETLRVLDGDLRLTVGELLLRGVTYRDAEAHAVIQDGHARLDPLAATLPGGRLVLRAAADATQEPPVVQLAARSEGVEIAPLLAAYGLPGGVTGRLELATDLRGRGRTLREVAASAHGPFGAALLGGQVSAEAVERALGGLRRQTPGGAAPFTGQPLELRCLALRFDARDGIAHPLALLGESVLGRIGAGEGSGTVNLHDERLALRLNTDLRLPIPALGPGGLRIRAPVPLTGTLAAPRLEWGAVAGSALAGEAANQAERQLGGLAGQILGQLGGAIGGGERQVQPAGPIPDCAAALALARAAGSGAAAATPRAAPGSAPGSAPGAAPAAPEATQAEPAAPAPKPPQDLPGAARELLRRLPLPGLPTR